MNNFFKRYSGHYRYRYYPRCIACGRRSSGYGSSSILVSCRSGGCCCRHLSDAQAIAERFCHAQRAQSIGPHGSGVANAGFTFTSHFNAIPYLAFRTKLHKNSNNNNNNNNTAQIFHVTMISHITTIYTYTLYFI